MGEPDGGFRACVRVWVGLDAERAAALEASRFRGGVVRVREHGRARSVEARRSGYFEKGRG